MAKNRIDSNPKGSNTKNEKGKDKKKGKKTSSKKPLLGPQAMVMKSKPKENPFDTTWSRKKFDILGKKSKGDQKRTGLGRSFGIQKRNNTLLKEYQQSGKSSLFIDKRIGEHNESLGEFDKAILRSQRARQAKSVKKSKYNLSDGEEDDNDMYSGGLSLRDDFDEELSPDEDEAERMNKPTLPKQINGGNMYDPSGTGSAEGMENKHKSKKEVMEEIISKSKFFKAQKSKDKEENEELMEQLDKDFTSLVQSQALLSLTQPGKMNALKALVNANSQVPVKKDEVTAPTGKESYKKELPDSYDKLVKGLALEMRARPSERTKTPEEIAQEERERLERLEEERQKRMLRTDDSSEEDGSDHDEVNTTSAKKLRSISGDDLGDSFSVEEEPSSKKGWVDEILERHAETVQEEEDGSSEDSESDEEASDQEEGSEDDDELQKTVSLKDWEQSDDDKLSTDMEDEDEDDDEDEEEDEEDDRKMKKKDMQKIKNKKGDSSNIGKTRTDDALPFVIDAPSTLAEFNSLLDDRSDSEVIEAINRIRTCNAIRLAAENRKKMQVFYGVLLQYFAVLANKKPLNFDLLNLLVKPLIEMSADTPYFAAICARQRIHHIRAQFCEDVKIPEKSSWPSTKTLFLLRLWAMVFPCSDFRHVVMTPVILLMCEYLMRCPITSGRDIAVGSFLCSMVLSITRQSKKFCPEAIVFLQTLLTSSLETEPKSLQQPQFFSNIKMLKPWLRLQNRVTEIQSLDFLKIMNTPEDSSFYSSDNFRCSVLFSVVETLRGFVLIYEGYNSFPEISSPISTLLRELAKQDSIIPSALQDSIKGVAELIEKKVVEHHLLRRPLEMRKQKPVPIKLLNPKFEDNFIKGRDYDPDRERVEKKKLLKQIKREAKGAARELQKDNQYLFEVKEKEKAILQEERNEKYGKAKAFLQEQEHAFKSGQLGKGKGAKRRR